MPLQKYGSGRTRKRVADADDAKRQKEEEYVIKRFGKLPNSPAEAEGMRCTQPTSVRSAEPT